MRILRGKSNLEVSSHGFALFVVGLILSTFLGGAVRTLLRSDQIHQRVLGELRSRFPKLDVELGTTEVLLSHGFWPGLGLKLTHLKLTQKTCDRLSFVLDVPSAVLPVRVLSLRRGRVQVGESEIDGGHLHLDFEPCPSHSAAEVGGKAKSVSATAHDESGQAFSIPAFDWHRLGQSLSGLRLEQFSVTFEKDPTWKVFLRRADARFGQDFSLRANVEVQKSLPFGTLSHIVDVEAQSEDQILEWAVYSDYKEGQIAWKGSVDTTSETATSSVDIKQLPIKDLLSELHQVGALARPVEMKATWLSCAVGWDGTLSKPGEMPLKVKVCKLEGAYGGATLEQAELFPLQKDYLKVPLKVKIENMQVQPLVEAFNRKVLPAVINRLGVWSGQFQFLNSKSWSLDGYLDNVEVVFSNQSVRGKQSLRKIHTQVEMVGPDVAAKIDQVDLAEGQFIGKVEFKLNEDWRNGTFQADIDNLVLSPPIQSLLLSGQWDNLKIRGRGQLVDGELTEWKGVFESSKVSGAGWSAEQLHMDSKFLPGIFYLESRAAHLELLPAWRYYSLMRDRIWPKAESMKWRDLKARIEIRQAGGEVLNLIGVEGESGKVWKGRGSWTRDRDFLFALNGWSAGKPRRFSVRSEKGLLAIEESP